jgi:hypothetical protein
MTTFKQRQCVSCGVWVMIKRCPPKDRHLGRTLRNLDGSRHVCRPVTVKNA